MKKLMGAGLALSAVFAVWGQAHAYVNYPWCVHGESRGTECVIAVRRNALLAGGGRGLAPSASRIPPTILR